MVVQQNLRDGNQYIVDERRHADEENAFAYVAVGGEQAGRNRQARAFSEEIADIVGDRQQIGQHRGQRRARDAHAKREDEQGVERDVDDRAEHHPQHRVFGRALRADELPERVGKQDRGRAEQDDPQIVERERVGFCRGAEQRNELRQEQESGAEKQDAQPQTAPEAERGGFAGVFGLPLAELAGDEGTAADSEQDSQRRQRHKHRRGERDGRHLKFVAGLADEKGIGQIVEDRDEVAGHRRYGEPQDGLRQRQMRKYGVVHSIFNFLSVFIRGRFTAPWREIPSAGDSADCRKRRAARFPPRCGPRP